MRAKKSLGQHFLTSKRIARDMVSAAAVSRKDHVLEIGPGKGILTEALLHTGAYVVAVEKDSRLISELEQKFSEELERGQLRLSEADALTIDLDEVGLQKYNFKVVANIPYYITGAILEYYLSHLRQPGHMTLLVQKEVAERIAKDKKGSLLSMSVRAYGAPRYVKTISAKHFKPQPKVDSAILSIEHISRKRFENTSETQFFSLLKLGFAHKRKKLWGNLAEHYSRKKLEKAFKAADISENTRAEELSINQWFLLTKDLSR